MGLVKLALIGGAAYYVGKKFNEHPSNQNHPGQNAHEGGCHGWGWGRHGHPRRNNQYPDEKQQQQQQQQQGPNGMNANPNLPPSEDTYDGHGYQYPSNVYPTEKPTTTQYYDYEQYSHQPQPRQQQQQQQQPQPQAKNSTWYGHDYKHGYAQEHPQSSPTQSRNNNNNNATKDMVRIEQRSTSPRPEVPEMTMNGPPAYTGFGGRAVSPQQRMFPGGPARWEEGRKGEW